MLCPKLLVMGGGVTLVGSNCFSWSWVRPVLGKLRLSPPPTHLSTHARRPASAYAPEQSALSKTRGQADVSLIAGWCSFEVRLALLHIQIP